MRFNLLTKLNSKILAIKWKVELAKKNSTNYAHKKGLFISINEELMLKMSYKFFYISSLFFGKFL